MIFAYQLLMNEFASSSFNFLGWLLFVNNVTIQLKKKISHILREKDNSDHE